MDRSIAVSNILFFFVNSSTNVRPFTRDFSVGSRKNRRGNVEARDYCPETLQGIVNSSQFYYCKRPSPRVYRGLSPIKSNLLTSIHVKTPFNAMSLLRPRRWDQDGRRFGIRSARERRAQGNKARSGKNNIKTVSDSRYWRTEKNLRFRVTDPVQPFLSTKRKIVENHWPITRRSSSRTIEDK